MFVNRQEKRVREKERNNLTIQLKHKEEKKEHLTNDSAPILSLHLSISVKECFERIICFVDTFLFFFLSLNSFHL